VKEIWKDIGLVKGIDYTGFYQVSNLGRVKSLSRYVYRNGSYSYPVKEKIKIQTIDRAGYLVATLCKSGKGWSYTVHRLVALAFIPNSLNKCCVNHKDGNKLNNNVSNLEWVTYSENTRHAYKTGLLTNEYSKKPVVMFSLDDKPLMWFDSAVEAERYLNKKKLHISCCCKNRYGYKTAGGYKWEYYKKEESQ
jgi:hypothetical protein